MDRKMVVFGDRQHNEVHMLHEQAGAVIKSSLETYGHTKVRLVPAHASVWGDEDGPSEVFFIFLESGGASVLMAASASEDTATAVKAAVEFIHPGAEYRITAHRRPGSGA